MASPASASLLKSQSAAPALAVAVAAAPPVLCTTQSGFNGTCISKASCAAPKTSVAGYCPGSGDIQVGHERSARVLTCARAPLCDVGAVLLHAAAAARRQHGVLRRRRCAGKEPASEPAC